MVERIAHKLSVLMSFQIFFEKCETDNEINDSPFSTFAVFPHPCVTRHEELNLPCNDKM